MIDKERENARIEYERIMKKDEGKDYLDILPPDFKNFKRSILKKTILYYLESAYECINSCGLYGERRFTRNELVRYMMTGLKYDAFFLAYNFIPRKDSSALWMNYASKCRDADDNLDLDGKYELFAEENKEVLATYRKLERNLALLLQSYEGYEHRQKVKNKELVNDYDIEDDGFPRTGRGNICYYFIPVKGEFPENKKGNWILFNPRSNKTVDMDILEYKAKEQIYSAMYKGKKVFLIAHQEVEDAYDALFDTNKEIYAGWWNRTLIKL